MYRVMLRQKRRKIVRRVNYAKNQILKKNPELNIDPDFVKSTFEKRYGYRDPKPYHELIRRPKPTDLPPALEKRIKDQQGNGSN